MRDSDELILKNWFLQGREAAWDFSVSSRYLFGTNFKLNGTWMEQDLTGFEQRGSGLLIANLCTFQISISLKSELWITYAGTMRHSPPSSPATLLGLSQTGDCCSPRRQLWVSSRTVNISDTSGHTASAGRMDDNDRSMMRISRGDQ